MNNNEGFCYVSIRGISGWRGKFPSSSNYDIKKLVCFLGNSTSMNQAELRQEGPIIVSAKWELLILPNYFTQQYLCRGSLFYVTVRNIPAAFISPTISEVP